MLAILDYKAGNLTSVRRAMDHLDVPCEITADPKRIAQAQGIIFPGVGAAGQAMDELTSSGLDRTLRAQVDAGKPLLGICVGCQILLNYCQENDTDALGIIPGECRLFNPAWLDQNGRPINVPHMGWNSVRLRDPDDPLFKGIAEEAEFYFVHSYYPAPAEEHVLGTTSFGIEFCSYHGRQGLWAVQFHPEKSGRPGLRLLKNFHTYCREAS
jgi:glutamine amidotransferase